MNNLMLFISLIFSLLFSEIVFSQDEDDSQVTSKDVMIKLFVGGCQRDCPTYSIVINGNGLIEYEGHGNVSKLGKITKQISNKDVAKLMSGFFNTHFFSRTDDSTPCYTKIKSSGYGTYEKSNICVISSHGPSLNIEAKYGNQYRKVHLSKLYSDDYTKLKQIITDIAGIKRWIKKK